MELLFVGPNCLVSKIGTMMTFGMSFFVLRVSEIGPYLVWVPMLFHKWNI